MESHTKASMSGSCSAAAGAHRGLFSHNTLAVLNITTKYKFLTRTTATWCDGKCCIFFYLNADFRRLEPEKGSLNKFISRELCSRMQNYGLIKIPRI